MNRGLANPVGSSVSYPTSRYAIMYLCIPTDFQVLKDFQKLLSKKYFQKLFQLEFKVVIFHRNFFASFHF